jgi:hypothetical protein
MRTGCPTSQAIVLEQLRRAQSMTLAETFQMEMVLASHCAANADFAEGVRALIIDKDNAPQWRYATPAELPAGYVESHFEAPWAAHPLRDLGGKS